MDRKISLYPEEHGRPKADLRQTGHKPLFISEPGYSRYQSPVSLLSFTKQETYLDNKVTIAFWGNIEDFNLPVTEARLQCSGARI